MLKLVFILAGIFGAAYGLSKIIGGQDTQISKHPYQISLQNEYGRHFCGGFLISKKWVVTAAHCVADDSAATIRTYRIRAGSSTHNSGGQLMNLKTAIVHPDFSLMDLDNDIALLQLVEPINVITAEPAKLPRQSQPIPDGVNVTVTGWGITNNIEEYLPTNLKEVEVPTINRNVCKGIYEAVAAPDVTDNMFCAGLLGIGGKDACSGDSGGPVARLGVVVGIVSWGIGCASPDYPGVYIQVSKYRKWIKKKTGV